MKKITLALLALSLAVSSFGQQPIPAIRGEINTYFPSTNNKSIQAVKLRETFNDVIDHVDTLKKKYYTKTIANTRLINNTNYELIYITDSGKEGWFRYISGSATADDGTDCIVAANGRRYKREPVLATTVADNAITNAKLANAAANSLKGNNTGSSAAVQDLTVSQARILLGVDATNNTSDANKPVSTATQTALNAKQANIQYREEGSNVGSSGEITSLNIVGPYATMGNSGSAGTLTINTPASIVVSFSDETSFITAGTSKVTFYMPYSMTVTEMHLGLSTPQVSGSLFTVDINKAGTTVLSTKLTVDNTEEGSNTAATAPVISDTSWAKWAKITIDVDQVGNGTAKGGKVTINGYMN